MIQFAGRQIAEAIDEIKAFRDRAAKSLAQFGPAAVMSEDEAAEFEALNQKVLNLSILLQFQRTKALCITVDDALNGTSAFRTGLAVERRYSILANYLKDIRSVFEDELKGRKVICIPPDKAHFWEQSNLFGEQVSKNFRDAQFDLKEAGNCLAMNLHTAAVFHLMRASEWGLRYLAEHLEAWPSTNFPIEFSQWKDVIAAINVKLDEKEKALNQITKSADKFSGLERYRGLLAEVKFLQITRDGVMHTRDVYNDTGAMDVRAKVESFMRRLAKMMGGESDYQI